jgi:CelD/BcsL family acetyltransferase involved in cellulose biosynthesis
LAVYGEALTPELLFFFDDSAGSDPIAACLLVHRQRALGMRLRSIHLNCSGEDEAETTYIEYNALVNRPGYDGPVAKALAAHVNALGWDRFLISGAAPQPALEQLSQLLGRAETERRPSYYVDLARLRRAGTPYRNTVSSNTRKQNSFTRRQLETTFGPCTLEKAATPKEAAEYFSQLSDLHNTAWQARAKPGMFASPRFLDFHRKLISDLFATGEIVLMRLRAGEKVIAVLYCFAYKRRIYFYQSGIFYGEDKRLRPGFLALALAIEHLQGCADIDEFDFLAGDAQYKKSLGTGQRELHWTTVWAPSISSGAFRALKYLKGAIG